MADALNLAQSGTMSPEDFAQQQQLNRQQQMAQMLMQQSQQPQGQMISGRYVAPSWAQSLVPLANIAASQYIGGKADTQAAQLAQRIREAKGAKEQAITGYITGTPEVKTELAGPYAGNVPMPMATKEGTKPDLAAALREISTNNPYGAGAEYKAALVGNMIPKTPEKVVEYNLAKQEGFKGSFNDFANQITPYQQAQLGMEGARLNIAKQQLANELSGAKLTESQSHAGAFQNSAVNAYQNMAGLEKAGFNPSSTTNQTKMALAGGGMNMFASPEVQQYKQAQDQFANAYLRFQSGANMSEQEIQRNLRNMMPVMGDKPNVIEQKRLAREEAIKSMGLAAGPANMLKQNPNLFKVEPVAPTTPTTQTQQTPSLWGKATVVGQ